ncbi:alpha-glucan family phosphorylase [Cellvibrio fibrivorans]|uniref:Starch phosphorylase n=1 Tax=Cellvibrio fibrivorans TaxID=126350 RepID=A0ABU1UXR1_9GAMM|nr:alpha-glucan family phosphorylase [Cellvibrio fibrivorans]MDR7089985.1 starch phosphorylase [Cellvibrio fibrivorans]
MPGFERLLPAPLLILEELAADLHWNWNHASDQLWRSLNTEVWEQTRNPVSVLQLTSGATLEQLASDPVFLTQLQQVVDARRYYLLDPGWYSRTYLNQPDKPNTGVRGIAYFSMEFGICDALPLYAGGLGILAGDYLKTASDLGLPLVGIGLLYQEGYFRQSMNRDGWQEETYLYNDPGSLPIRPLRDSDGRWLDIETGFLCRRVRFRIWVAQVGKVKLYLLDSNHPCNQPHDRGITSKLYGGGTELRLVQEIALGIGGWRLIETLGLDIDICHLNEGHAAFATLERIRSFSVENNTSFWESLWATRAGNLFTTHTPVAAGFDRYPTELLRRYAGESALAMGVTLDDILVLGRADPKNTNEPFNMAYLAMRTCAHSNGVSELHGRVSQRIFQPLFPRWPEREVPVSHVTNGVHMPTWDSPEADAIWTQAYGKERWRDDLQKMNPNALQQVTDQQLWHMAASGRARLVDYARQRFARQWRHEVLVETNLPPGSPNCEIPIELPLDPNILTLGFARRFAEYKRPDLLLHDPERLARILCNPKYPVQLIVAGKAHPADTIGKTKLQGWQRFLLRPEVAEHLLFIEDYDISLAQHLVQGVDVWINNPRRPWEASGTSGMKILVNGGLNLSTLDGWWAEAYKAEFGWALGDGEEHDPAQDSADAEQLYRLLENDIIPRFYARDAEDIPREWIEQMRSSMAQLTPRFSSNRMLQEYIEKHYLPAATAFQARVENHGQLAKTLNDWTRHLHRHWHEIHIGERSFTDAETGWRLEVNIYLGAITPDNITVEAIADNEGKQPAERISLTLTRAGIANTYHYSGLLPKARPAGDFSLRVIPAHPQVQVPIETTLICWQT